MSIQINKEGRTRYKRKYFFPNSKDWKIETDVCFNDRSYWGKFIVAELPFKILCIVFRCPHCGLQMYGIWYRDEQFIAKRKAYDDMDGCYFNSGHILDKHSITFRELWGSAERECEEYVETSRKIEEEIIAVRAMDNCPLCGEKLSEKKELEIPHNYYSLDDLEYSLTEFVKQSIDDFVYKFDFSCYSDARKSVRRIQRSTICNNIDIEVDRIADNSNTLQKYIEHLLNTEATSYLLAERLDLLYLKKEDYLEKYTRQQAEELSKIADAQYSALNIAPPTLNDIVIEDPLPVMPQFNEKPPVEPVYSRPGVFNKKKILEHNELLRTNYHTACQNFNRKKAEYDKMLNWYHSSLMSYKNKKQEAFERALNEHRQKMEAKRASFIATIDCSKSEIAGQIGDYILYQETIKEIGRTEELYSQSYACLQSLYSCGVIYNKYRNPVALASFIDYLGSGRCTTLTGADGAYNIYETEVRLDRIITKLDEVIGLLNQIKDNQYALYSVMSEINENLNEIRETADAMEHSLSAIKNHQENISNNTAVIAHNTAVTALYAKKTAELTNALGFMVALK